jgi:hypothetical protein
LLRRVFLDVHAPGDVEENAALRAAALACLLPHRLVDAGAVVALAGAAWVLAAGEPPRRLDVVLPPRRNLPGTRVVRVHQMHLDPDDVTVRAAVRVTGPVRTLADLARDRSVREAELRRVAAATGCRAEEVLARLERLSGHRGVAHARRLVSGWAAGCRTGSVLATPTHHPVGVEHAVHLADGSDDVSQVGRVGHLEGEP